MRTRMVLAAALVLTLGVVIAQTAHGGALVTRDVPDSERIVVDYYEDWAIYANAYRPSNIDFRKMTHLNYAFAKLDAEGNVVMIDPNADNQNFPELQKLKAKYPHLKTLISLGGWRLSKYFSTISLTDAGRKHLAKSAVDFMQQYGFDGVDIDWEYPVGGGNVEDEEHTTEYHPDVDKRNFTLLMKELRAALDTAGGGSKHYLLTAALAAGKPQMEKSYEVAESAQYVDWYNIMTYDFHGGWENVANHNAPLFQNPADPSASMGFTVAQSVQNYLDAGLPKEKLVVGMPFYGRGWDGCPAANNGLFQTCAGMSKDGTFVSLDAAAAGTFFHWHLRDAYVNKNGFKRYWDDVANVPYLYRASDGRWISYDDAQSIKIKAQWIKEMGLKGAMAWTVSTDKGQGLGGVRSGPLVNVLGDTLLPASLTKKGDKPKKKACPKGKKRNKKGKCVKK